MKYATGKFNQHSKDISRNNLQLKKLFHPTVIMQKHSENHRQADTQQQWQKTRNQKPSKLFLQVSHVLVTLSIVDRLRLDEVIQTVQVMGLSTQFHSNTVSCIDQSKSVSQKITEINTVISS